jgi:ribonuclease-3
MKKNYADLQKRLGYTFKSEKLLIEALTHSSAKDDKNPSNERLEFLGDSVLGLVVTEHIFNTHPDLDEGELTTIKSVVVSKASLMQAARQIKIRPYLKVGKRHLSEPSTRTAASVKASVSSCLSSSLL